MLHLSLSKHSLVKILSICFLFLILVLPSTADAFEGGFYNEYVNKSDEFPDFKCYKYFFDTLNDSSTTHYVLDVDKLKSSSAKGQYFLIDFPAGSNFNKLTLDSCDCYSNGKENIFFDYNRFAALYRPGDSVSLSYQNSLLAGCEDYTDGHVTIRLFVPSSASGKLSFSFRDSQGSFYTASPCSYEEQTVITAYKDVNGNLPGEEKPEPEEPEPEPESKEPITSISDNPLDPSNPVTLPLSGNDTSGVLNSIIEGIKIFISTVIKNLLKIITVCVGLGIVSKGALWLWRKAKIWFSNS